MKADLHCHTTCSDSSVTPEMLVQIARTFGVDVIAVTDHDTMAGVEQTVAAGKQAGLPVIPGTEISARDPATGRLVHILCYAPTKPEKILEITDPICESRNAAAEEMIQIVRKKYPIPEELVRWHARNGPVIFKQHIMHALRECGYCTEFYGELHKELFHSKTGCAYVPVAYPTVWDALDAARESGAFVVLAHPFEYDSIALMHRLVDEEKLDGIEVYHSRCTAEQSQFLVELAQKHGLAMSGGSDFHGYYSSRQVQIGCVNAPEETVRELLHRINSEQKG